MKHGFVWRPWGRQKGAPASGRNQESHLGPAGHAPSAGSAPQGYPSTTYWGLKGSNLKVKLNLKGNPRVTVPSLRVRGLGPAGCLSLDHYFRTTFGADWDHVHNPQEDNNAGAHHSLLLPLKTLHYRLGPFLVE